MKKMWGYVSWPVTPLLKYLLQWLFFKLFLQMCRISYAYDPQVRVIRNLFTNFEVLDNFFYIYNYIM